MDKKKGGEVCRLPRPDYCGPCEPQSQISLKMLHFVDIILKEVFDKGRNFTWPSPPNCPRCQHYKVWGHGFVERFFDCFPSPLQMKRFRCNNCGCVICCRPETHFARIQSSSKFIKARLAYRITHGLWPPGMATSRQRHWLKNLKRKTLVHCGTVAIRDLLMAYDKLLALGHVPVSCSV